MSITLFKKGKHLLGLFHLFQTALHSLNTTVFSVHKLDVAILERHQVPFGGLDTVAEIVE
ncbi:MAG: hypothetical protein DRR16_13190 [Candidatus Parabeggiatoa sp. nov. 3]|nr:MAG: hypothetical protein DRR00_33325 [Gammaproteobacteria bacterium]RKZ58126.1 MAG: hypothetical protein DRQ99_25895 [Gammaproteobacteria bacterium]RKZ84964.1 MAG: hypothetical protein DRR16_13190 [Gammaproteobacteria bacterium]